MMKKTSYRVDEVAETLHCSERTVRNLIKREEIEAFKIGHTWRIREDAIEDFTTKKSGKRDNP